MPKTYVKHMRYLARFNLFAAVQDLRLFLAQRERHELLFFFGAVVATALIVAGFIHDSHEERPYKREIIYVQSWPLSRTEAEILAQQKIDQAAKDKQQAEERTRQEKVRAQFRKLDQQLDKWGF